jgi:hypothetical protein
MLSDVLEDDCECCCCGVDEDEADDAEDWTVWDEDEDVADG